MQSARLAKQKAIRRCLVSPAIIIIRVGHYLISKVFVIRNINVQPKVKVKWSRVVDVVWVSLKFPQIIPIKFQKNWTFYSQEFENILSRPNQMLIESTSS